MRKVGFNWCQRYCWTVSFFLGDLGERKKEKKNCGVEVKNKDSKQEQILKEVEEGGEDFQTQRKRQRRLNGSPWDYENWHTG